jgi:hypothetical protein
VKQHAKQLLASIAAIRKQPRAVKQHAEQLTLDLYGRRFEDDRLRRLLRDARQHIAEHPDVIAGAPPPLGAPAGSSVRVRGVRGPK